MKSPTNFFIQLKKSFSPEEYCSQIQDIWHCLPLLLRAMPSGNACYELDNLARRPLQPASQPSPFKSNESQKASSDPKIAETGTARTNLYIKHCATAFTLDTVYISQCTSQPCTHHLVHRPQSAQTTQFTDHTLHSHRPHSAQTTPCTDSPQYAAQLRGLMWYELRPRGTTAHFCDPLQRK